MTARPLRDFFRFYAILAAYNLPIMHNGRLAQQRTFCPQTIMDIFRVIIA